jgi:hypothetical protein
VLREYVGPNPPAGSFVEKCRCLFRLGLAVGHAKRSHLRRVDAPALREGFLIERSVLAVAVDGISESARPADPPPRELIAALREVAAADPGGMSCSLVLPEKVVDWAPEADAPEVALSHSRHSVGSGRYAIRVRGGVPDWAALAGFARTLANSARTDAIRVVFPDRGA